MSDAVAGTFSGEAAISSMSGTALAMGHQGPARMNLTLMLYPRALRDWQGSIDVYAGWVRPRQRLYLRHCRLAQLES